MAQPLRALVGARVSVVQGPQKVSHIAQQETGAKWVAEQGHTVVGSFKDLDVSATVSPFERPDLGPWLSPELEGEWDILVFSKIDRMFRSTRDCVKFAEWAEAHGKILVFAEDSMTLNYRDKDRSGSLESMMSELFIYIGSFFAQLELNRFKSRARDSHRVLRGMDRWASGVPPLGFRIVDHPSGKGKGLDTDPEGKAILEDMAAKLLDGWSFIRIAQDLNQRKVLTNMDKAKIAKGKPPHPNPWTVNTVIESLTSPRTQGIKMTKHGTRGGSKIGTTVLDAEGNPIRLAPPTFDPATWKQIQEAAARRQGNRRSKTYTANPMLGVGYCGACGASLAQQFTHRKLADGTEVTYRTYRCGRTPLNCNGISMRGDEADGLLEQLFLEQYGSQPVTEKVFVPGEDHSEELEQVRATIDRLRRESDAGLIATAEDERIYFERMKSLIDRRTRLEAQPRRASGWVTQETDKTNADEWAKASTPDERRRLLMKQGIRFELVRGKPDPEVRLFTPGEIPEGEPLPEPSPR
ncbi:integrase [Mycobacterium phage Methuselah]|uniref:Integrase n=2 Tax=Mycobacterium phage Bxz2 TaxID=205870 RepID=R4JND1_BPMB2|nr:integrase [Mycobacterium phage Methuselah]QDK02491.1 serine integrase [Mycobacterium phage Soshari]